ncbi:MAG: hypothetical protein KIT84_35325 [Labilithrix sp.]|nr:hypothetical protein [Labilithrix sp.]MCW5816323.1 hypothetical protein [Labilithrix sp.]
MLDQTRIRHDIAQLNADCIHLKKLLRATWTRPMADEQRRQARVRRKLTELFVVLAAARGRLHVVRPPRDVDPTTWDAAAYHRRVSERLAAEYAAAVATPTEVRT